jgi:hypothetical protein
LTFAAEEVYHEKRSDDDEAILNFQGDLKLKGVYWAGKRAV